MNTFSRLVKLGRFFGGLLVLLSLVASVVVPNYQKAKTTFPRAKCVAQQRVLTASVDLYRSDNGKDTDLTSVTVEQLVKEGYLDKILNDPGQGEGSWKHYRFTRKGTVFCTHHGLVRRGPGTKLSPREQLKKVGVADEKLLAAAQDKVLPSIKFGPNPIGVNPFVFLFASLAIYLFCFLLSLFVSPRRTYKTPDPRQYVPKK